MHDTGQVITVAEPGNMSDAARALREGVTRDFDLDGHELSLLADAARCQTAIDDLEATVEQDGRVIETRHGELKVHPALAGARQQRIVLTRILATLGLKTEGRVKQPREARGADGIRGAVK